MHWAALVGANATFRFIIHHNGDLLKLDKNGRSPLHLAIIGNCSSIVDILIELKIFKNVSETVDNNGLTPLFYAIQGNF